MEKRELRPVCSLGMFDFFKGYAIFAVVLCHTIECFGSAFVSGNGANPLTYLFVNTDLPLYGFFIAAGYGIRKRPWKKCWQQIRKIYLPAYVLAGVLAPALLTAVHFLSFRNTRAALGEGLRLLAGFLLGQYPSTEYGGCLVYSCGPMWFVVALAEAWFILNGILYIKNEKLQPLAVAALGLLGYGAGQLMRRYAFALPYCLSYSMLITPCLYLGYLAKKHNFFEKKPTALSWAALGASLLILTVKYREPCHMAEGLFPLGLLSLCAMYVAGLGLLYLMTHINRRENFLVNALEKLGHNTMDILIFHTVEYYGLLWYRTAERFAARPILGTAVILALRWLFIAAGTWGKEKARELADK